MSEGIEKKCINIEKKSIDKTHSYSISIDIVDGMGQKPVAENIVRENDHEPGEGEDYANRALRVAEQQKRRRVSASKCRPTDLTCRSPTTNIVD